ncbi:hypothetical protein [Lysinibacillus sp. Y5S-8]
MANQNKIVFIITHDQDFIDIICDEVLIQGKNHKNSNVTHLNNASE